MPGGPLAAILNQGERIKPPDTAAEAAMQDDESTRDQVSERAPDLATLAGGDRTERGSKLRQASRARQRAELAKRHEVEAHARAIDLHERAAELQERLGHPDRAATAREHAEHARRLHALALAEQSEQQRLPLP